MSGFYTYVYYTQEDASIPTYVGKGHGWRFRKHRTAKTHFGNHLRKQMRSGIFPIVVKYPQATEQEALDTEVKWIAAMGRQNIGTGPLYNKTDGGEGCSGMKHTQAAKQKLSRAKTGVSIWPEGRKFSPEHSRALSEAKKGKPSPKKGKPLTAEHRLALSLARRKVKGVA